MITIGLDPHPGSHTVAALDNNGALHGTITVPNDQNGLEQLLEWSHAFPERRWAVEGANHRFIAEFVARLSAMNEPVFNIAPNLTCQYRARRGPKKSDVIDAQNVARALIANPSLPPHRLIEQQRALQELTRTRHRLSGDLKANQMELKALRPDSPVFATLEQVSRLLTAQIKLLELEIKKIVQVLAPTLLEVRGVGAVIAGVLLAETGDVHRFPSAHHFASYAGAAPVERGSGRNRRVQVNAGGNRRLNWALHIVARVRLGSDGGRSKALLEKQRQNGKSHREGLRVLKTYVARELFG